MIPSISRILWAQNLGWSASNSPGPGSASVGSHILGCLDETLFLGRCCMKYLQCLMLAVSRQLAASCEPGPQNLCWDPSQERIFSCSPRKWIAESLTLDGKVESWLLEAGPLSLHPYSHPTTQFWQLAAHSFGICMLTLSARLGTQINCTILSGNECNGSQRMRILIFFHSMQNQL